MVPHRDWMTPKTHESVAYKLIQRSSLPKNDRGHAAEVLIHEVDDFRRRHLLRETRETTDIGKKDRELTLFTIQFERFRKVDHLFDDMVREVAAKRLLY